MDEKQKDKKVLLVADKEDGGKLKVVDKSSAQDGILRMLLPSMENLENLVISQKSTL